VDSILFTTARLKIRNLIESDLDALYQYRSNPEVVKYQGFDTFNLKQAKAFIEEQTNKKYMLPGEWIQFGIEHISTKQLVGDCAIHLHNTDSRIAETGITISHLHQRMGYGKETILGMIHFLFTEKDIHRIIETVDVENHACIKLMESVGFRRQGHFADNTFLKGRWTSEFMFTMLKKDWKA
jgi:[ribosomal protein S5]-alanine N-acetyltransferase